MEFMTIGAPVTYTMVDILQNVISEFERKRYNYVPVSIYDVDYGKVTELCTLVDVRNYMNAIIEDGAYGNYRVLRVKEGSRCREEKIEDEDCIAFELFLAIVVEHEE